MRSTWSISSSFCVAGAALWSTSSSFCVAGAELGACGRCSTWSTSVSFCVAGAALGAPKSRFAWHVQHWTHLSWVLRGISLRLKPSIQHHPHYIIKHTIIKTTPSPQHHQHNLINTTSSTHHHLHNTIYTTPSTLHHQHNTIYTTSSTQHCQHNLINTSPSTQHHQHNTIYTASSNTGRYSIWSTAILAFLPHSCWYPFCYSSLWIVLSSVLLTYSIVGCPKTLLTCGVIRSYNFTCCYPSNSFGIRNCCSQGRPRPAEVEDILLGWPFCDGLPGGSGLGLGVEV